LGKKADRQKVGGNMKGPGQTRKRGGKKPNGSGVQRKSRFKKWNLSIVAKENETKVEKSGGRLPKVTSGKGGKI